MKANRILLISLGLNLAFLLCWAVFLFGVRLRHLGHASDADATSPPAATLLLSNAPQRPAMQATVRPIATSFDWRQVESEDYKQYLANLRSIGCPEKTIKEIITADVNDLFASRRANIMRSNRYEYWRASPVNLSEEQQKQLTEIDVEKIQTLKTLEVESADFANLAADYLRNNIEEADLELDFLPDFKRQRINELRYQQHQQALIAGLGSQKAEELEHEAGSALNALLTRDELHEYELRTSVSARQLRAALNYLEPTEREFRIIFDTWNNLQSRPPGSQEYREAQTSSEASLRNLLGSNRLEVYLKGVESLGYTR